MCQERVHWASAIEWLVVRHSWDKKKKKIYYCERVKFCVLRVARRVQQLSQYVNVKINGVSSFFVKMQISKISLFEYS
jgi:hypothetical protein